MGAALFVPVMMHTNTITISAPSSATVLAPRPVPASPPKTASSFDPYCTVSKARPQSYFYDGPKFGPLAFGPEVSVKGAVTLYEATNELRHRLCGTATHGADERLWAGIDYVVNGHDPNDTYAIPNRWRVSVDRLVNRQIIWNQARVGAPFFSAPPGSKILTLEMMASSVTDGLPQIITAYPITGPNDEYLYLPIVSDQGRIITVVLRLKCGFQPYFASQLTPPTLVASR